MLDRIVVLEVHRGACLYNRDMRIEGKSLLINHFMLGGHRNKSCQKLCPHIRPTVLMRQVEGSESFEADTPADFNVFRADGRLLHRNLLRGRARDAGELFQIRTSITTFHPTFQLLKWRGKLSPTCFPIRAFSA